MLDACYSCVFDAFFLLVFSESHVDLACADDYAGDVLRWVDIAGGVFGVRDDPLEVRFAGEIVERRAGEGVAEERFREEDNEC